MNPFEVFDETEIKKVSKVVGNLENRTYTQDEWGRIGNFVLDNIMSKSSKNGDIDRARNEFDSILSKIEIYRGKSII